jgi:pimeloyl-ACP methyl ester carboxylesterase
VFGLFGRYLRAAGFAPRPFSYASVRGSLAENAASLRRFTRSLSGTRINFVGHSLGGLIVGWSLLHSSGETRPGRVVLMGAPFADSYAARRLLASRWGRPLAGSSLREWLSCGSPVWSASQPLGIVAGSVALGMGRIVAPGLPRPNDGAVAVRETVVAGATDRIVLPVTHSGMLVSPDTARQAAHFLEHGAFDHRRRNRQ